MNNTKSLRQHALNAANALQSRKKELLLCIFAVYFWGILAHAYGFLHSSLSHDGLNAFIATVGEESWKIELGRFFVPLYRAVFRGPVSLPWLNGMLGLLWTSLALFLFVRIFDLRSTALTVVAAGILTTNITNIAQIATYVYEFDFNAFSLLLSLLSVYLWHRDKGIASILAGALCLMVSIGIYQAYFAVTVTLIVWKSILDLIDGKDLKEVFLHGLRGISSIALGGILYFLAGKLVCGITGIDMQRRADALNMNGQNPILVYLRLVLPAMLYLARSILHPAYRSLGFIAIVGSACVLAVVCMILLFRQKQFQASRVALILALTAVLPFAMTSVYFLAKGEEVHDLTKTAIWFFYLFIVMLAFRPNEACMQPCRLTRIFRAVACIMAGVILWQNLVLANTAYVKKEMESNAALSTMTRVVSMMDRQENYQEGSTKIAFIGVAAAEEPLYGMERVTSITGLHNHAVIPLDSSNHYYNAYKAYFTYVLQQPVLFCSDEEHAQLKKDPRVQSLPAFPQDGCMEIIDGILVIKMG